MNPISKHHRLSILVFRKTASFRVSHIDHRIPPTPYSDTSFVLARNFVSQFSNRPETDAGLLENLNTQQATFQANLAKWHKIEQAINAFAVKFKQ